MEKLPMCRICLVKNVRMFIVANRNLHILYERLTDIPFITEDRRSILACCFCYAKLKQCYRLLRQCLEAEQLFAQKLNDYEPDSLINEDHIEFFGGFITTAIENISIIDVVQTENIAIKEEFTDVCEELDNFIELQEEHQIDGVPSTSSFENEVKDENRKMFLIFEEPDPGPDPDPDPDFDPDPDPDIAVPDNTKAVTEKSSKRSLTDDDQNVIDEGQKKVRATQCDECGAIYQIGDPQKEHDHLVHHNATDVLKYIDFKGEYVVHRSGASRCIRVRGGEKGWKKVEQLLSRLVHPQLGYRNHLFKRLLHTYTAYLYIQEKQILGCLIVEPKMRAHKLILGNPDGCSVEDYPVKCGVSRMWTHINHRRCGIASSLLACVRASFLYGVTLEVSDIAFSAPTADGKAFATKYCETPNFYVYDYRGMTKRV